MPFYHEFRAHVRSSSSWLQTSLWLSPNSTLHMTDPWHGHTFQHFCNKFNFFAKLNADGIMVSLSCHWRPYTLKRLILHDALFESLFPYDLPLSKWLRHHQQLFLVIFLSLCYPMRICIHSFPQMGWKFFSAESTPLVIQQSPVTWQVIVYVFTLYFICLFIFLFLFFYYYYYY